MTPEPSSFVRQPNSGYDNDSAYDIRDNASCFVTTQTMVVKEEIVLIYA
jgi:hypothetical protein